MIDCDYTKCSADDASNESSKLNLKNNVGV